MERENKYFQGVPSTIERRPNPILTVTTHYSVSRPCFAFRILVFQHHNYANIFRRQTYALDNIIYCDNNSRLILCVKNLVGYMVQGQRYHICSSSRSLHKLQMISSLERVSYTVRSFLINMRIVYLVEEFTPFYLKSKNLKDYRHIQVSTPMGQSALPNKQ